MTIKILFAAAALSLAAPALAVNIASNGSFETGDFTGWAQFGDTSFTAVVPGAFFQAPTDGDFQAVFGPVDGIGGISQTIASTATTYVVTFDLGNSSGSFSSVDFGGVTLLAGIGEQPFTPYSFTVTTGANPTLSFSFFNPPSYYTLDNITVTAVPEPASWALMIGGFAMTGFAMRRRKVALAA